MSGTQPSSLRGTRATADGAVLLEIRSDLTGTLEGDGRWRQTRSPPGAPTGAMCGCWRFSK